MYEKQNFKPEQVLSAAQLNHIEDGIVQIEENVQQELENVKKRGSDVKERLAAVITEKGVETASGDDWDTVIDNAEKIPTGGYVVPAQAISANGAHGEENIVLAQAISANVYLGDKEATI